MSFIFDAKEDPAARARKRQAVMGALQSGAMQRPGDLGSGLSALGSAMAYRAMQNGGSPSGAAQAAMKAGWDGVGGMSPAAGAAASAAPAGGMSMGRIARALFGKGA